MKIYTLWCHRVAMTKSAHRLNLVLSLILVVNAMLFGSPRLSSAQTSDDQALQIARQAVSALNNADYDTVYALFSDALVKALTKDQIKATWESLLKTEGTYNGETNHTVNTVQGHTIVVLTLEFANGRLTANISVTGQGKIDSIGFHPAPTKLVMAPDEQEVTFKNGTDTIYGTLLIPVNARGKIPAVLLISDSGPVDRDGNSALLPGKIDSQKQFARILANVGVASLRFDKYGTGKTGLGSYANNAARLTFDSYVSTAVFAYQYLSRRSEIDPTHMAILGHGEGGLIALLISAKMQGTDQSPVALILAAPLSQPFLIALREQYARAIVPVVTAGKITQKQADALLAEFDQLIAQVIKDGTVPAKVDPALSSVFSATNSKFLQDANQYDPPKIATMLPVTLKVLLLCGLKDEQVPCTDVQLLVDGFKQGGNTNTEFNQLANVDFVFKEISGTPNMQTDYIDPTKPFSVEATQLITAFAKTALLTR